MVECSATTVLKCLTIFEQEALNFHFVVDTGWEWVGDVQSSGWLSTLLGLAWKQLGSGVLEKNPWTSSPSWSPGLAQVLLSHRKCSMLTCLKPMTKHGCVSPPCTWAADPLYIVHLVQPKRCCHLGQPGPGALSGSAGCWQLDACHGLSWPGTCWVVPAGPALQTSASTIWSPSGSHAVPWADD